MKVRKAPKYVVEYWLPNQSRLFSDPQRATVNGDVGLKKAFDIAEKHGYEIIGVYELVADYMLHPVSIRNI